MQKENLPWFDFRTLEDGDHEILIEYKPNKVKQMTSKAGSPYGVMYYKIQHNNTVYMCSFFESVATTDFPQGINGADVGDTVRVTKMGDRLMYVNLGQGVQQPYKPTHQTPNTTINPVRVGFCWNMAKDILLAGGAKGFKEIKKDLYVLASEIYHDEDIMKTFEKGFPKIVKNTKESEDSITHDEMEAEADRIFNS